MPFLFLPWVLLTGHFLELVYGCAIIYVYFQSQHLVHFKIRGLHQNIADIFMVPFLAILGIGLVVTCPLYPPNLLPRARFSIVVSATIGLAAYYSVLSFARCLEFYMMRVFHDEMLHRHWKSQIDSEYSSGVIVRLHKMSHEGCSWILLWNIIASLFAAAAFAFVNAACKYPDTLMICIFTLTMNGWNLVACAVGYSVFRNSDDPFAIRMEVMAMISVRVVFNLTCIFVVIFGLNVGRGVRPGSHVAWKMLFGLGEILSYLPVANTICSVLFVQRIAVSKEISRMKRMRRQVAESDIRKYRYPVSQAGSEMLLDGSRYGTCSNSQTRREAMCLEDVFETKESVELFVRYCVREFSTESILFLIEFCEFKEFLSDFHSIVTTPPFNIPESVPRPDILRRDTPIISSMEYLYDKYLIPETDLEINVSAFTRSRVSQLIQEAAVILETGHAVAIDGSPSNTLIKKDMERVANVFDPAVEEILPFVQSSFERFKQTKACLKLGTTTRC